ncbi:hypothetical protein AAD018_017935 [Aestuariibius insulae]|uniref:hypothetical protein n=1 Tax=Aestuariibius insulae TaxID=2058287 RepID=UPI00345E2719
MRKNSLVFALAVAASQAMAEDPSDGLSIELNAIQTEDLSCRLTFVITNGMSTKIEQAVYEIVLFDPDGQVERLTLLDFAALPSELSRVRQFVVPDLTCDQLGRILFNNAHTCISETDNADACSASLQLSSRTQIEVIG